MGNVTAKGAQSFVYNAAAQMNEAKLSGASVGTYVYNAFNQRASKTVSSVTTHYVYGSGGVLLGKYDSSGTLIREYIYANGEPLAQIDAGSPETIGYTSQGIRLGCERFTAPTAISSAFVYKYKDV